MPKMLSMESKVGVMSRTQQIRLLVLFVALNCHVGQIFCILRVTSSTAEVIKIVVLCAKIMATLIGTPRGSLIA